MRIDCVAARERDAEEPGSLEPGEEEAIGVKRFAVLLLAVLGAPVCLLATTYTVTIAPGGNLVFDPASQTINVGDTVTWTWGLGQHSSTSGVPCLADDTWNSGLRTSPNSFSVTFPSAGTFSYFCQLHCSFGMTGQIIVQAVTDTPTPTATATPTPTPTGTQTPPPTPFPPTPGSGGPVPTLSGSMLALLALALAASAVFLIRRG
jgi:plastocyanin